MNETTREAHAAPQRAAAPGNAHAQASASAAWIRDGLESVAAALERIARALEQRPAASEAIIE